MKQIIAYIEPNRLAAVTLSLLKIKGLPAVSCAEVRAFARNRFGDLNPAMVCELIDYVPSLRLEIFCPNELVHELRFAIQNAAKGADAQADSVDVFEVCRAARVKAEESLSLEVPSEADMPVEEPEELARPRTAFINAAMRTRVHHPRPPQGAFSCRAGTRLSWSGRRRRRARPASSVQDIDTPTSRLHTIRVEFCDPEAHTVAIIGSFNRWRPRATPMVQVDRGRWMGVLFLPPGRYEYLLVVDGHCVPDPRAQEVTPNVYGMENSVLIVPDRSDFQPAEVVLVGANLPPRSRGQIAET